MTAGEQDAAGTAPPVDEVRYDVDGPVAVVTIDRQHRRNAIDGRTAAALAAALARFDADDAQRVMVLTGAGAAFCAGADLTAIDTLDARAEGGPLGFTRRVATKPTIAAVDGWAVAGGLELALWCDLRIASPRARFGCLERRWGVPLVDGGTWRLPRVVGLGRALDLILTGRVVDADEALAMGLVTSLAEDPVGEAVALAHRLAAFPQETLCSDRTSVYDVLGRDVHDALAREQMHGLAVLRVGAQGAARFAAGAGRGGVTPTAGR